MTCCGIARPIDIPSPPAGPVQALNRYGRDIDNTGCQRKIVLFHYSKILLLVLVLSTATHPSATYNCKRISKLSTHSECTVTPIGWPISVQPIAAKFCRGRVGKITQFFLHTLYFASKRNEDFAKRNRQSLTTWT